MAAQTAFVAVGTPAQSTEAGANIAAVEVSIAAAGESIAVGENTAAAEANTPAAAGTVVANRRPA